MDDEDPAVSVTVDVDTDEPEDENNNGVPDVVEMGVALERATQAQDDAENAAEDAENAAGMAGASVELGLEAHQRIDTLEANQLAMANTLQEMTNAFVGLRDLVTANAQATGDMLEHQMRGPQPDDQAPDSNHWLTKKWF